MMTPSRSAGRTPAVPAFRGSLRCDEKELSAADDGAAMTAHVESSPPAGAPNAGAVWRSDIDALAFRLDEHSASCMVHRRAFRTLLGFEPAPADCLRHFCEHEHAFRSAAAAKIAQKKLPAGT